jgi:hypothetical protein
MRAEVTDVKNKVGRKSQEHLGRPWRVIRGASGLRSGVAARSPWLQLELSRPSRRSARERTAEFSLFVSVTELHLSLFISEIQTSTLVLPNMPARQSSSPSVLPALYL